MQVLADSIKTDRQQVHHDRSKDPKPKELMQLPVEVVGKIMEKLDLPSRLTTRNVCKPLRTIVDGCELKIKSVNVNEFSVDTVTLRFDRNPPIRYYQNRDERGITIYYGGRKFQRKRGDAIDFAMNDLKTLMKSHNLELDSLTINSYWEESNLVKKTLNSLRQISRTQFKVKVFEIRSIDTDLIVPCLTLLKPGFLESIHVNHISDQISSTAQWQQAKIGRLHSVYGVNPSEIKHFWRFEEFNVHVHTISANVMVQLIEALITSPSFKKCVIKTYSNSQFTIDFVSTALGRPIQNQEVHVPIPDSTSVLVIAVVEGCINIKRRPP